MLSVVRRSVAAVWRGTSVKLSPPQRQALFPGSRQRFLSLSSSAAGLQQSTESDGASGAGAEGVSREPQDRRHLGSNWNYTAELSALAQRLGHDVQELPSLKIALTHRSFLTAGKEGEEGRKEPDSLEMEQQQCNDRLGRLGGALLRFFVEEYLFFTYPRLEGKHSFDIHTSLTHPASLARVASYLGVTDLLLTGLSDGGGEPMTARALQAVVGALYVDKGASAAKRVVNDFIITQLAGQDFGELIKLQHPKFMLRAVLRSQGKPPPVSRLMRESGRLTHFPSFVVGVYSGEKLLAEGCGTSLKRAEREAVTAALQKHFQTELSQAPLPSDHEDFRGEFEVKFMEDGRETN